MIQQVEAKYHVFDSLEEMLTPEILSDLLSCPVRWVDCQPMTDHNGLGGSQLSHVNTNAGRLVLKQMLFDSDFIMFSTDDRRCRSVTLWQYGLLDRLLPYVEHRIIACAKDDSGWAILMEDLSQGMFGETFMPFPFEHLTVFLDRLARLHATFWNDPQLNAPRLGISVPENRISFTSPVIASSSLNKDRGPIPKRVTLGWEIMETLFDHDVYTSLRQLTETPKPLLDAINRCPFTLIHGDYRAANLAYLKPDHYIAFDWQLAARSLMTVDLIWFTKKNYFKNDVIREQGRDYYRRQLETNLGIRFPDLEWQKMMDLGILVDAFTKCFPAYLSKHVPEPEARAAFENEVKETNQPVRAALRWL
jgi:hypothetical protein